MKRKTLIFLKPFTINNPTLAEQNAFMVREIVNEMECADLGYVYTNEQLYGKDIAEFISKKIKQYHPVWVIAEDNCATVALHLKKQKKILINPEVTFEDLNNVSEFTRQNTFGFFDNRHEQDYVRFLSVYPHAGWFPQDSDLALFTIKEAVKAIKI